MMHRYYSGLCAWGSSQGCSEIGGPCVARDQTWLPCRRSQTQPTAFFSALASIQVSGNSPVLATVALGARGVSQQCRRRERGSSSSQHSGCPLPTCWGRLGLVRSLPVGGMVWQGGQSWGRSTTHCTIPVPCSALETFAWHWAWQSAYTHGSWLPVTSSASITLWKQVSLPHLIELGASADPTPAPACSWL